jgi:hypothetical protein
MMRNLTLIAAGFSLALLSAPAVRAAPETFDSPEAAADALKAALHQNDSSGLLVIFGRDQADVINGPDPRSAAVLRQQVATLSDQGIAFEQTNDQRVWLYLGRAHWPLPVSLVQQSGKWVFDVADGRHEVIARRVGFDERATIDTMGELVRAEQAYTKRFGAKSAPVYAAHIQSRPGETDGLWWDAEAAAKAGKSPLGGFARQQHDFLVGRSPGDPFHGYHYRILTAQGPGAPGGARSYVTAADSPMTGFAFIAWPVTYRVTGVKTFIVGMNGKVLEADLGKDTDKLVRATFAYNPGPEWKRAE